MFLVRKGEGVDRLEPKFHLPKYRINEENIRNSKFSNYQFRKVTTLISDGTHFTPKYTDSGIKFLSVKDVRAFEINYNNSKFISEEEANFLDKRCKPTKGDILLTKIGTTGLASVIESDERFQIFVSVALLRPNLNLISPDFLNLCLNSNLIRLQFERVIKGAGVPDLHLEDIRKVKTPVPPHEIQAEVVANFETAYTSKKQKEAEAAALLASIDSYLLQALGITLPPPSAPKNYFYTRASKVSGGRFDASFYQPSFAHVIEKINSGLFNVHPLKNVVCFSTETWNGKDYFVEKFPYIEISEIDIPFGEIRNINYVQLNEAPSRAKMIVRNGDLLISTTRPSRGAITHVEQPENEVTIASTGFAILRETKNKEINKNYLLFILATHLSRDSFQNQRVTGSLFSSLSGQRKNTHFSHQP